MSNPGEMITIDDELTIAKEDVIETFSDTKLLEPYIKTITDAVTVEASEIDLTTDKGRKAIASRAHKVSKIKTKLSKIGKESVAELKEQVTKVNQGVAFIESNLSSLRDSTREPLNAWEAEQKRIEEERVAKIQDSIQGIYELGALSGNESIDDISALIDAVSNIDCKDDFAEFTADALKSVSEVKDRLSSQLQALIQQQQQDELNRKLAEERNMLKIQERLNNLRMIPVEMVGKSAAEISKRLKSLETFEIPEAEFGDRYPEAVAARHTVVEQLNAALLQAQQVEKAFLNTAQGSVEKEPQQDERLDWDKDTRNVVNATEYLNSEPATTITDEQHEIAEHLQQYCHLDPDTAISVAECITETNVPHITFNRKAA